MKILDTPRINKLSNTVAFQSRYGLCLRALVVPRRTVTQSRQRAWGNMAYFARAWSAKLTQAQQERWIVAAGNVLSRSTLSQCGPLTGEQFFIQVNLIRACCCLSPIWEPPPREVFGASPVGAASVVNGPAGLRLLLAVTGPVTEDIMVFGQAPCSTGRHKRRNVAYIGLLPPAANGVADLTDMYVAKYGPLRPNTKIFIVTRQQKNGWEGPLKETSAIVPREEGSPQSTVQSPQSETKASVPVEPEGEPAGTEGALSSIPYMHTGGTGDAQGVITGQSLWFQASTEPLTQGAQAAKAASPEPGDPGGAPVK
jgi:hypothetical protein